MSRRDIARAARTMVLTSMPRPTSEGAGPYVVVRAPHRVWEVPLDRDALTIGRAADSDVFLGEPGVSRHHARIERRGDSHAIVDLGSTNGTWLGLQRIAEHVLLDGDTIFVGGTRLIYKRGLAEAASPDLDLPAASQPPQIDIAIDEASCRRQVEEVVTSDAYRAILARARKLRQARQR